MNPRRPRVLSWLLGAAILWVAGVALAAGPIVLPMRRSAYVVGERIPLGLARAQQDVTIDLVSADEAAVTIYRGPGRALVLDTAALAPGDYRLRVRGIEGDTALSLSSRLRESAAAITDESCPKPGGELRAALRATGINALFATGYVHRARNDRQGPAYDGLDDLAATGAMAFLNPMTRPSSFHPARGGRDELAGYRHRLALYAQANARYPSFGGFWYDWDGASLFGMQGLMQWFGLGKRVDAFRTWCARRDRAVYDEFRRRTGLEGVTQQEFLRYCLAKRRPEFAPTIDYVTFKLNRIVAGSMKPLTPVELARLEQRVDAWGRYVMGVYAEAHAGHQRFLRGIVPSLRNTTSLNIDHNTVRGGHWHPADNAVLDFRYMSTWNDQVGGPDYSYQWLFTAGVHDIGRRAGQPVWISSALGGAHGRAAYPGKFLRMAGHVLAYGGGGLGFALEGFSTVLGGMNRQTQWPQIQKADNCWQDLVAGREFLKRFVPLARRCGDVRQVAILYSQAQHARQHLVQGFGTGQFQAFVTLSRLGYLPRFVTERQIAAGDLAGYGALVVVSQTAPLPAAAEEAIRTFVDKGGKVFVDRGSTARVPGAAALAVTLPFARIGAPHNWPVPNAPRVPEAQVFKRRHAACAGGFYAALGDALRTPLMSARGARARASTFALDAGPDATYVLAVNDAVDRTQADWVRLTERLVPNGHVAGALYDLTKQRCLGPVGPVDCVFDDLTVRLYGIVARAVESIALTATQGVRGGESLPLAVRFLDAEGTALRAAVPLEITLRRPDGSVAGHFYRATGRDGEFALALPVPANAPAGGWSLRVRSLLDGRTASLAVSVSPGPAIRATPLEGVVLVRGRRQIEALLARKPAFVLPLFDGPKLPERRAAAEAVRKALASRGVGVQVRERPAMTTYTISYDPNAAEAAANARARKGEAFGRIRRDTDGYVADYESAVGGYLFGRPVILLDLVAVAGDNPPAERLERIGALWPNVSKAFPGPGHGTVQVVRSALAFGADALVLQAANVAGLRAAARSLAKLPDDWITPSVAGARAALLREFGIGPARAPGPAANGLTAKGLRAGIDRDPLAIRFGQARPPRPEQLKGFVPKPHRVHPVPGKPKVKELVAYYRIDGKLIETIHILTGDCRFFDALMLRADVERPGPHTITLDGVFRYSDRTPLGQGQWDAVMAAFNALPKKRLPMSVDVLVDGKPAGRLGELTASRQVVPIYLGTKKTVEEEAVTRIRGTVTLPAGVHEIMLIHHNIVDGRIAAVTVAR